MLLIYYSTESVGSIFVATDGLSSLAEPAEDCTGRAGAALHA